MPDFAHDPPLPKKVTNEAFMQTVRLLDAGKPIGSARWHVRPGATDGVAQLLDLTIMQPTRQGYGGQLIDEVTKQARAHFKARGTRLRRMWMAVEQKGQII